MNKPNILLVLLIVAQVLLTVAVVNRPKVYNITNHNQTIMPKPLCSDYSREQYRTGDIPIRCMKGQL